MKDEVRVVTRRAGGKWEGIGTLLIVAGHSRKMHVITDVERTQDGENGAEDDRQV